MEAGLARDGVEIVCVEGARRIRLLGECDLALAPAVRERLDELVAEGETRIVFDLEHVTFLDSSVLSIFLSARRAVHPVGEVVLLCRPGFIRRLLGLLEMDRLLRVCTPEEWRRATATVH